MALTYTNWQRNTGLATSPGINAIKTLHGWNQLVDIDFGNGYKTLRVSDYAIGSEQSPEAPDFVTGSSDRTAWYKGPVTIQGSLSFPFTLPQTDTISGVEMFQKGAELSKDITETFVIRSSASEVVSGCKINEITLSCEAGGAIEITSSIMATSSSTDNTSNIEDPDPTPDPVYALDNGEPTGSTLGRGTLTIAQIPMWDAIHIQGAPDGMLITGFSITINNNLRPFYTLGNNSGASPFGLNPTSIGANQRRITGNITWQSDANGLLDFVRGSGITEVGIFIGDVMRMTLTNCVWNAAPPRLSPGDRVTVQTGFTALGSGGINDDGFDALVLSGSGIS